MWADLQVNRKVVKKDIKLVESKEHKQAEK
jgi:hypothetical protein